MSTLAQCNRELRPELCNAATIRWPGADERQLKFRHVAEGYVRPEDRIYRTAEGIVRYVSVKPEHPTMRYAFLLLLLLLLAPLGGAQNADSWINKLDTPALVLVESLEHPQRGLSAAWLEGLYDVTLREDGSIQAGVFIRLENPAAVSRIEAAGFHLGTLSGNIAVGTVVAEHLPDIARMPDVLSVSIAPMAHLVNDLGGAAIGLPLLHEGTDLPSVFRGQGVIVGIVDTGIDFSNPDFSDEDGTRIEYLLEYLPDPDNNPPQAYAEWNKEQIDANPESVTQVDVNGHGTHVTGTAAGSGGNNLAFVGAASESRIIVVKATRTGSNQNLPSTFSTADMVNAVAYIFAKADELNMPAVVNLSIGGLSGANDGSSPLNQAFANLAGPGRIIVFAAGNDGSLLRHWGTVLEVDSEATMGIRFREDEWHYVHPQFGQLILIEGWYDSGTLSSITISARDHEDEQERVSVSLPVGSNHSDFVPLTVGEALLGYGLIQASITSHPDNGDGTFTVVVASLFETDIRDVLWSVTLESAQSGEIHAWTAHPDMGFFLDSSAAIPDFVPGDSKQTLSRFASGYNVIIAGAFTTRNQWYGSNEQWIDRSADYPLSERARFSSRGPTRDGRVRPDVLAPGMIIASSVTSSNPNFGSTLYGASGYRLAQGTSMAAPFLAGTIALMLQAEPEINPTQVRQLLRVSSDFDPDIMGDAPNGDYGYGRLDAFAAVQATLKDVSSESNDRLPTDVVFDTPYPNPARFSSNLVFYLPESAETRLEVIDLLGRRVRVMVDEPLSAGPHRVSLERSGLASGVYFLILTAGNDRAVQRIVLID